ncbi:hypothetical protein PV04_09912 [Phialophora macrospora]|uniref:C2H2-type domain-containing protein n=1 Tax=Phialophora macrospora TaxID=1851006 RepID=A0A0D2F595_9EURO|nr:hypothetical protein PV04_09912 [Phialophora macrospora]
MKPLPDMAELGESTANVETEIEAVENCDASTSTKGSMNKLEASSQATSVALFYVPASYDTLPYVDGGYSYSTDNESPSDIDDTLYLPPDQHYEYFLFKQCDDWVFAPALHPLGTGRQSSAADGSTNDIPDTHLGDTGSRYTRAITYGHKTVQKYTVLKPVQDSVLLDATSVSGEKLKYEDMDGGKYIATNLKRHRLERPPKKLQSLALGAFWPPNSIKTNRGIGDTGPQTNEVLFLPYSLWQKRRLNAVRMLKMPSSPVHYIVRHRAHSNSNQAHSRIHHHQQSYDYTQGATCQPLWTESSPPLYSSQYQPVLWPPGPFAALSPTMQFTPPLPPLAYDSSPDQQYSDVTSLELDYDILNNTSYLADFNLSGYYDDFTVIPTNDSFIQSPLSDANFFASLDSFNSPLEAAASQQAQQFCCQYSGCTESFSRRCELTRHEFKHTKPFRCPHCGRAFAEKRRCVQHIQSVHDLATDNDKTRCHACDYAHVRPDAVKRHLRLRHGIGTKSERSSPTTSAEQSDDPGGRRKVRNRRR